MALTLVTAPAIEPLSVTDAKLHLRVDGSSEDTLIETLTKAARQYVETFTGRRCVTQTWDRKSDGFPGGDCPIVLPYPPVSSVTSVTYVDQAGDSQTWTAGSTGYLTDLPAGPNASPARIYPAYGITYPVTRTQINAVTVRFVCGYTSGVSVLPGAMVAAMKLLVGHWYANRESVISGRTAQVVPQAVDALLWPLRSF